MKNFLQEIQDKIILEKHQITKEEAEKIYNWENLDELKKSAGLIRKKMAAQKTSACALINAKQGKCGEDCKYCAQSRFWNTGCQSKEMIQVEEALQIAKAADQNGINRICVITSGRALGGSDFERAIEIVRAIKEKFGQGFKVCASLGLLDKERLLRLKAAGVSRVHHNLETSQSYFPNICTTHTYEQKMQVIQNIKSAGLELCSGGIIGMGEEVKDRIDAAFVLREIKPDSIPINILTAVKGTPFEKKPPLSDEDFFRTIAMIRFTVPKMQIRLAAGRKRFLDKGREALLSGANAFVSGDLLTLKGAEESSDAKMLREIQEL
ncbi:MAG: biotin synthase BioB [Treponema sp.]|nr:biotin synthase BioB [Treponema sp.]